jgi:exodeoxyribonuclease VII small subunit
MSDSKRELTFEAAMAELEATINALESGKAPLSELLAMYERGVGLIKYCMGELDSTDKRIKLLHVMPDGDTVKTDLGEINDK